MPGKHLDKHVRWAAPDTTDRPEPETLEHNLPLTPRDEAIFLLHTAAEVEHALLVQYLYAAYSLRSAKEVPPDKQALVRAWKNTLLGIAREEMGHLITVQNVLRLIGGPLNLEREDYPFRSDLYPFHFRLERVTRTSLAKYVVAEMPLLAEAPPEIVAIQQQATGADQAPINRVGALYVRIARLFAPPTDDGHPHLADADFVPGVPGYQAHYDDWGDGATFLIPEVHNRADAIAALQELAEQGEGLEENPAALSHYQRFLALYQAFPEPGDWEPTYDVPSDPTTSLPPTGQDDPRAAGRITESRARRWAQLCNLRYRLLLAYLAHFLQLDGPLRDAAGARTPRGFLQQWPFDEMRRVGRLAGWLATLPRWEGDPAAPERAGAPFELPYTLALPDREPDRWRSHAAVLDAALGLIQEMQQDPQDAGDAFLHDLQARDREAQAIMRAAAQGAQLPPGPVAFQRVVRILDEAVRGLRVGAHHNFWRDCTRDEFIHKSVFDEPLIAITPDGRFDPAQSNLSKALRGEPPFDAVEGERSEEYPRMPAHRPPVAPEHIAFITQWIADGCPDNDPPGQIGLTGEPEPGTATPTPGDQPAAH
jgi:hypothetical protein